MEDILRQGALAYGLSLTGEAVEAFRVYSTILHEKNAVMNLTTITDDEDVARLHFLDSLALATTADFKEKTVIDIGSGAGFPGLPLKLAEPSLHLTLLDAQQKRVGFLQELSDALRLGDVRCIHARAEEAALEPPFRDAYDVAVSRAVARLNILCELCLPFVKPGGVFISMKSVSSDDEIKEAENAIRRLGGEPAKNVDYTIPGTEITHRAVVINKTAPTPSGYPRRFAKIQKTPL